MEGWQVFLGFGGLLASISVPMYLFMPVGTSKHFNHRQEPIGRDYAWWVQSVAAGDALIAFICLYGVLADGADVDKRHFCLSALALYSSLHMFAFGLGAYQKSWKSAFQYGIFAGISVAAWIYWS